MTDNGGGHRSHQFQALRRQLRLRHCWTRPYIPRTDGKTERFIRTCLAGWAYHAAYRSWRARAAALPDWLQNHKFDRCHTGIGFITSAQRLAQRQ